MKQNSFIFIFNLLYAIGLCYIPVRNTTFWAYSEIIQNYQILQECPLHKGWEQSESPCYKLSVLRKFDINVTKLAAQIPSIGLAVQNTWSCTSKPKPATFLCIHPKGIGLLYRGRAESILHISTKPTPLILFDK